MFIRVHFPFQYISYICIAHYKSDSFENIVNNGNGSSFRKLSVKSSSVKLTKCEHVFDAYDPYRPFPFVLANDYFDRGSKRYDDEMYNTSVFVLVNLARLYRSKNYILFFKHYIS